MMAQVADDVAMYYMLDHLKDHMKERYDVIFFIYKKMIGLFCFKHQIFLSNGIAKHLQVRFNDCDPLGHLNKCTVYDYMLNAREDHLGSIIT